MLVTLVALPCTEFTLCYFVFNESYNHRLFPTFGCVYYIIMGRLEDFEWVSMVTLLYSK